MTAIGFHTGPGGNRNGIGEYWQRLHAAGIPFFQKAVDDYGPCFETANIARGGNVPHSIVFRLSTAGQGNGYDYDVPNYNLPPAQAAAEHWYATKLRLPPEFDKSLVWVEPINEVDKQRSDWLGDFAAELGLLANSQGYKVTLFGWSSGEPEYTDWQTAGMRRYLTMCAANPDRLAVSLHEYSYSQDIQNGHPNLVGRFKRLFDACTAMGIGFPTVHITEWGWEQATVPDPENAMIGVDWAYRLYAPYSQIKGVATWYLGGGWGGIANQAQGFIAPVTDYMLNTPPVDPAEPPPLPVEDNILPNYSFENGWWHIDNAPELQIANQFDTEWKEGELSPGNFPYVRPEYRVLPAAFLPPAEQPLFILDGTHTIKVFKGYGAINTVYKANPILLAPGRYRLTVPVYPDAVMEYVNGQKVFADDPLAAEARIWHDGEQEEWANLFPFGNWRTLTYEFDITQSRSVQLGVRLRNRWPLVNSGWFTDKWELMKIDETPPVDPPPGDTLKERLWNASVAEQIARGITLNPQAALQNAIRANGQTPVHREVSSEGYVIQAGEDVSGIKKRRVYVYQPGVSIWSFTEPIAEPPSETIDLLPYLRGDGRQYEVRHPNGAQETFQTQTQGDKWKLVKNSNYESLYLRDGFVWRDIDISPGPAPSYAERPGEDRYYTTKQANENGAKWIKRYMKIGEVFLGNGHHVQFYYKSDCAPSSANSGFAINRVTLIARHDSKTYNGITLNDLIELRTNTGETMMFCKGYGLVAWVSDWGESAISEIHENRPPLVPETNNCY